jgi:Kef-type K+ transport system membrane component KefB
MDQFLRVVAVLLEVSVLGVMILCLVWGLKLLLEDLGMNKKYDKVIVMALAVVFFICVIFFTIHLSAFYPAYSGA